MTIHLLTYRDMIDRMIDGVGGNVTAASQRELLRAIEDAYDKLANEHNWRYLIAQNRINTVAPYSTGTVVFDFSGGAYERMLTLTGGTWPSWALYGDVTIGGVDYEVEDRKSSTIITLRENSNPGEDVASTTYTIYRDTYPLPSDFVRLDQVFTERLGTTCDVHPSTMLGIRRSLGNTTGTPARHSIVSDPNLYGQLGLRIDPPPAAADTLDMIYRRRPRALRHSGVLPRHYTGTVAVTGGAVTVTGTGTSFDSTMIGSVIRLSVNATALPTDTAGANPWAVERIIMDVASATSLTVDSVIDDTYSGVKFQISCPIDLERSMFNAFRRGCEYQLAIVRNMTNKADAAALYRSELIAAMEADNRSSEPKVAGVGMHRHSRLSDYPYGSDS